MIAVNSPMGKVRSPGKTFTKTMTNMSGHRCPTYQVPHGQRALAHGKPAMAYSQLIPVNIIVRDPVSNARTLKASTQSAFEETINGPEGIQPIDSGCGGNFQQP